jgi:3-oxoacyl-[acyl-carrier protein] reductase
VVLVTGAGSGIGLAITRRFLAAGSTVGGVILPGDEPAREALAALDSTGDLLVLEADVTDREQVDRAVATLAGARGPVDVLASNAGIGQQKSFLELTQADWDRMLAVHVGGAVNVTRACLPQMIERRFGRIIYTSSELAAIGLEELTHYCAAKGALVSLAKALAREVGEHGVTVNCVAPGPTLTPLFMQSEAEFTDENRRSLPLQTFGDPDNIAWTWLMLAGDAGRWYTGQVLSPNGGAWM